MAISSSLSIHEVIALLERQLRDLYAPIPVTWRYPQTPAIDPLHVTPDASWPEWSATQATGIQKNAQNWFYGELTFPAVKSGMALAGTDAKFFISGWTPFTLWVNGEEQFKETHAWHATGPITEPIAEPITPGKTDVLTLCVEPTELPGSLCSINPVNIQVLSMACITMATELGAAVAQLRFAEALAATDAEKALVVQATACIDATALHEQQWDAVRASIAEMEQALAPLSPRAKAMTVHLMGHSHIDMDWMWTWKDTEYCIRRDFKAVADMMDDYPELTFTHSQVATYKTVLEKDPDVFARVKHRMQEGRWENAAATWVEGDLNMADGESIARHMLYAQDWMKAQSGSAAKILWEPDTFGHPGNMPQLAKLGEIDAYFHMRGNPGREHNWPVRVWEGIDGTPITTFSLVYNGDLQPESVVWSYLSAMSFGLTQAFHVWGIGDHGGGVSRHQMALLAQYRDKPLIPTFKFSTFAAYQQALAPEKDKFPTNKGETYHLFEGCFTTHASIKRYNRYCEGALLTAEALSALAGLDRKEILREAWTPILFNHFHDIMDGAAVHDSYLDAHARAEKTLATAGQVTQKALASMVEVTDAGSTLTLVNPLGFSRSEPVYVSLPEGAHALRDSTGQLVPVQRMDDRFVFLAQEIPAFGRVMYQIVTDELDAPVVSVSESGDYFKVETACAISQVSKASGVIGSYFDKTLQREFVAYGMPKHMTYAGTTRADLAMNVFQVLDEAPNSMSAWLVNDILREENLLRNAEVTLVETGPVFARFRVKHAFRASKIEEDIVYYQNFPRVDFTARVDWRERGSNESGVPALRVSFATGMSAARARFEGPFTVVERPADGLDYPTQKWAALSGDACAFALLNDSKYGCDALGGRLRISLLRNSYGPDPESDNGEHIIRFAFMPYASDVPNAELVRHGMAYNRPPVAVQTQEAVSATLPQLIMTGSDTVVCTALRIAEHSDKLLVRFCETSGEPCALEFSLGRGILAAEEVNFLENPTGAAVTVSGGKVAATFHPYEVKTFLIKCQGWEE